MRWTGYSALVYVQISLLTCVAVSQCDFDNQTIPEICREQSNNNVSCTEFSGDCIECFWEECNYGETVNVTCRSQYDGIECMGEQVCTQVKCTCRV